MNWLKANKNKITFAYILCFVCYIAINEVAFVVLKFQNINKILYSVFAVFGALLILADLFLERRIFKAKGTGWLIGFVGVILISTAVNISFGFAENIKTAVWTAITMLLLYPFAFTQKRESAIKQLKIVANVLSVFSIFTAAVSLWQYIMQITFAYALPNDPTCPQGFMSGRLFGVFTDPNYASVLFLCIMALGVFYIANTKNIFMKIFHIVNIVLCYFYVVLSASRTAQLVMTAAVVVLVGLWAYKALDKKKMKQWLAIGCTVLIALSSAVITFASFKPVKYYASYVPSLVAELNNPYDTDEPIKPIEDERPDVGEDKDISNHRFEIWSDALMLWEATPIVGTSPRNHLKFAEKYFPESFMAQRQYSTHNGYLAVLTYTGVLGAAVILGFALMYILYAIKKMFRKNSSYHPLSVAAVLSLIVLVAIAAFPMMMIFFVNTIRELIFWLMLGYVIALARCEEDNDKQPVLYRLSEKIFAGKIKNED